MPGSPRLRRPPGFLAVVLFALFSLGSVGCGTSLQEEIGKVLGDEISSQAVVDSTGQTEFTNSEPGSETVSDTTDNLPEVAIPTPSLPSGHENPISTGPGGENAVGGEETADPSFSYGNDFLIGRPVGLNVFPLDRTAGTLAEQFSDIRRIRFQSIRVTFWFGPDYLAYDGADPDFSHFDEVVRSARASGLEIVTILAYVPNWLRGRPDWKKVYIDQYVKPVTARYKGEISYYEIWNEPDLFRFDVLDGSPEQYYDLVASVSPAIRAIDPAAKILGAASSSIQMNGISNFEWNERLRQKGVENFIDIYNIHYYGGTDIKLATLGNMFAARLRRPIWVTEFGAVGQDNQLSYFENVGKFIIQSLMPDRLFWYSYKEGVNGFDSLPPGQTYGLITFYGGGRQESSLYRQMEQFASGR